MAAGRRSAQPVPGFGRLFKQGAAGTDGEEFMRRAGKILEAYLLASNHESYSGLPAPHGSTHGTIDPIPGMEDVEMLGWLAFQRADES